MISRSSTSPVGHIAGSSREDSDKVDDGGEESLTVGARRAEGLESCRRGVDCKHSPQGTKWKVQALRKVHNHWVSRDKEVRTPGTVLRMKLLGKTASCQSASGGLALLYLEVLSKRDHS